MPYADTGTDLSRFRVGDLLLSPAGDYYLLGDEAPERLSPFAAVVYSVVAEPAQQVPTALTADFGDPETPPEWPGSLPQP